MTDRWTEHGDNTHSDIEFAWKKYGDGNDVEAGLLMLQCIARNLAALADEAEERRMN